MQTSREELIILSRKLISEIARFKGSGHRHELLVGVHGKTCTNKFPVRQEDHADQSTYYDEHGQAL